MSTESPHDPIFTNWQEQPAFDPVEGLRIQAFSAGALMANRVLIQPNVVLPRHEHPNEQLVIVLEGLLKLDVGGQVRQLGPGELAAIPPHVPHEASSGPEGCTVLDVFTPPRDAYLPQT